MQHLKKLTKEGSYRMSTALEMVGETTGAGWARSGGSLQKEKVEREWESARGRVSDKERNKWERKRDRYRKKT